MLNGSGSLDNDGSIVSYVWSENGVVAGSGQSVALSGLTAGSHTLMLTVTDDDGATDTDTVVVAVAPAAGGTEPGQLIANPDTATVAERSSVTINILSNDFGVTDNTSIETNVSPYASSGWIRVDQTAGTITYTPYIGRTGLDTFSYRLRIRGTGVSAPTTVTVNIGDPVDPVDPPVDPGVPNTAPMADAGSNQNLSAGENVSLNGSGSRDADGSIASYVWSNGGTQVGTGVMPVLSGLGVGVYNISLLVTDNEGATDTDSVSIAVSEAPVDNIAPVANAGVDQTIDEGESVTLNGAGSSDIDGNIVSYIWSENGAQVGVGERLSLSGLSAGSHTISLLVTDNSGATGVDTIVVSVNDGGVIGGALLAVDDEASVEINPDGSGFATIYFSANDQGSVDDSTFYISQYGTDGTDAKGWVRRADRARGVVYYYPYARGLINAEVDYFTYVVSDGNGNRSSATVKINILPPAPPVGCDAVGSANETISLLLVGNSLMNEIQSKLGELLKCRGYFTEMATSNPGGYWLYLHDDNERTTDLIAQGYDLTLLQEQSSGITTHSPPYEIISSLQAKIEAAGSVMGFYQTWGLQNREPVKTEAILSGYEEIAAYFDSPIVHIGRAWDYFYTLHSESPPFSLYVDYAHPTQEGKALISYVLYAYLTGQSPVGTPSLGIDADDALLLQTVAWDSHQANQ